MPATAAVMPKRARRYTPLETACQLLLSLYGGYVCFLSKAEPFASKRSFLMAIIGFGVAVGLFLWGVRAAGRCFALIGGSVARRKPVSRRGRLAFFGLAFLIALAVLGANWMACYPGSVSPDVCDQWAQVQTNRYDNWHPVFHTLFIKLCTLIYNDYSFALLVQVVLFSLALAYLVSTVQTGRRRVDALILLTELLVALSPVVRHVTTYLWKDNAMSVAAMVFAAQSVKIVSSRGQWLRKPLHVLTFALATVCCCLFRVNGFLLVLPFWVVWAILNRRELPVALAPVAVALVLFLLVRFPLYGALKVTYPDNFVDESVGVPMVVLADAYADYPWTLDDETQGFMNALAPQAAWKAAYQYGSYNSVKFAFTYPNKVGPVLQRYGKLGAVKQIAAMALRTAAANPLRAFNVLNEATDLVWDITGKNECYEMYAKAYDGVAEPPLTFDPNHPLVVAGETINSFLNGLADNPLVKYLTQNVGVPLLLLMALGCAALPAGSREQGFALLLILPCVCYCLGTMLLLCGNDARFFQCVMTQMPFLCFALIRNRFAAEPATMPKGENVL